MADRDESAPINVRERAVLTVFDHSGPEPRAVTEVDVVAEHGRVISRTVRPIGALEASRLTAERLGGGWTTQVAAFLRDDWRRTVAHAGAFVGRGKTEAA